MKNLMLTKTLRSFIKSTLLTTFAGASMISYADTPTIDMSQYQTTEEAQAAIELLIPVGQTTFAQALELLQANEFACEEVSTNNSGKFWSCSIGYPLGIGVVNYFVNLSAEGGQVYASDAMIDTVYVKRNAIFP